MCLNRTGQLSDFRRSTTLRLVVEYLDRSRLLRADHGQLKPFDQPAVIEALRLAKGVPGAMLALLRRVMEHAAEEGLTAIGADYIRQVFQTEIPLEPEDAVEEGALPPTQVNLQENE